jgi:imidazolonepropionase-like amidohydrolase
MRRLRSFSISFTFALLAGGSNGAVAGDPLTILDGVHVVHPHTGVVDYDRVVVIRDGRIAAIAPMDGLAPPADADMPDVTGLYVMPGLAEMHAHVPSAQQGRQHLEEVLFLWVANGITTIRGMLGEPSHLALRDELQAGDLVGPRLITSGPSFNGSSVSSPEQARRMALEQGRAGYDFFKLHPGLEIDEFEAIVAAAESLGMPFGGHVSDAVGLARTLAAGQATIDHLDAYIPALSDDPLITPEKPYGFFGLPWTQRANADRIRVVAEQTAAAGLWNVPTQSLVEHVLLPDPENKLVSRPQLRFVSARTRRAWLTARSGMIASADYDADVAIQYVEYRRSLIKALHDAGAGLLLGSDSPQIFNVPGFSIHDELAMLEQAGLTPAQAITTGTLNPAEFLGANDEFGRVSIGLSADLVLTRENPLQSLAALKSPAAIVLRGRWLSRERLDKGLAAIADRHSNTTGD